jgi:perosamine synthetase
VFFWPLSGLAVPARVGPGGTPVAAAIHRRAVNLPSYHDLDDAGIDRVCEVLERHLGACRNRSRTIAA